MNGVVGLSHYVYHFYVVIYGLCKGQNFSIEDFKKILNKSDIDYEK